MRVAVVHDWLSLYGGAERVLEQILTLFPQADLFSVIDFFPPQMRKHLLEKKAKTTFIQRLPLAKKAYRLYLPLMPLAIEQLDVTSYDLVISSSHAVAKGIISAPDQRHICYCHSPMRYAWDLQHHYLQGKKKPLTRLFLHKLRLWDVRSSFGVDTFIANSQFIRERIAKCYRRDAHVVYPPVAVQNFTFQEKKSDFYVTAGRFVSYKKIPLIVDAFRLMPKKRLFVIGEGPERKKWRSNSPSNVTFTGFLPQAEMAQLLGQARAFIYAAVEDFGIAPLEAQACGTPVIAYKKGGVKESCQHTALFFGEQSTEAICRAIKQFEKNEPIAAIKCRANAERFSEERFRQELITIIGK